ncbi:FkbM family methyltransferase [Enterobacteriaceae bacterium RIT711]|nr:FkbM family methyltransferase [Enterobacteriaceae bacterium RIT711]
MTVPYTIKVPTIHGDMLINRFDINQTTAFIKTGAALDHQQIDIAQKICHLSAPGSQMLDIGSNFGSYALSCARTLKAKGGEVHAFEGQRILAYMICGSTVLNSIENLFVHHACVGNSNQNIPIPCFDYNKVMNFGSIEFGEVQKEKLHQERGVSHEVVRQVRIDDFSFENVCFMKVDVEGMELHVLAGAEQTIKKCLPVIQIETLKSDADSIVNKVKSLSSSYNICQYGPCDILCITDSLMEKIGLKKEAMTILA